jgi:hypothetical protein
MRRKTHIGFWRGSQKRDHNKDIDMRWSIILKWMKEIGWGGVDDCET